MSRSPSEVETVDQTWLPERWELVRQTVRRSVRSSLHCTVTSINPDGSPQASPIGTVLLTSPGHGMYFDVFNTRLTHNLDADCRATILAVDSSKRLWGLGLLRGSFDRPPGVRLVCTVGKRRPATDREIERWRRSVGPLVRTRGGSIMWGFQRAAVRDIQILEATPLHLGAMSAHTAQFSRSR